MKRLLLFLLIAVSVSAYGQPGYTNINARYNWYGGKFSQLHIPAGPTPVLGTGQWVGAGALFLDTSGTTDTGLYYWHGGWVKAGGSPTASNGLTASGSNILLGQSTNQAGNPALLTSNREIPFADLFLTFNARGSVLDPVANTNGDSASRMFGFNESGTSRPVDWWRVPWSSRTIYQATTEAKAQARTYGSFNYRDSLGNTLYAMGLHYQDAFNDGTNYGTHYFFEMFNGEGTDQNSGAQYTAIEVDYATAGGNSHTNFVYDGSSQFGLAGNQRSIFGRAIAWQSIRAFVHIKNTNDTTAQIHLEGSSIDPPAWNGNIWYDSTDQHLYMYLGGVKTQLDNDAGGGGGVTSVAAGLGMSFSTITSTGSVILDTTYAVTKGTTQVLTGTKVFNTNQTFYKPGSDNQNTISVLTAGGNNAVQLGTANGFSTYGGMWLGNVTPSLANAVVYSNGTQTIYNASSEMFFRIGNVSSPASALYVNSSSQIGINTNPSARLHVVSTTEQLRVGYDGSNYYSATVGSAGSVTLNAVGASSAFTFSDAVNVPDDAYASGWNGSTQVPTKNAIWDAIQSGVSTPTITGISNVASSSTSALKYTRVGDEVQISGFFLVTPTGTGLTQFSITLPIASNFTSTGDSFGTVTAFSVSGDATQCYMLADATTDVVYITFTAAFVEATTINISGHYIIK